MNTHAHTHTRRHSARCQREYTNTHIHTHIQTTPHTPLYSKGRLIEGCMWRAVDKSVCVWEFSAPLYALTSPLPISSFFPLHPHPVKMCSHADTHNLINSAQRLSCSDAPSSSLPYANTPSKRLMQSAAAQVNYLWHTLRISVSTYLMCPWILLIHRLLRGYTAQSSHIRPVGGSYARCVNNQLVSWCICYHHCAAFTHAPWS